MGAARSGAPGTALPKAFATYLRTIEQGLGDAPPSVRDAVLADIRSQIDDNLSRLDHPVGWSEGEAILARLGTPTEVLARHGRTPQVIASSPSRWTRLLVTAGVAGLVLVPLAPQVAAGMALVTVVLALRGALRPGPNRAWSVTALALGVVGLFCCAVMGAWFIAVEHEIDGPHQGPVLRGMILAVPPGETLRSA